MSSISLPSLGRLTTQTTTYTARYGDTVLANAASAGFTVTLPVVASNGMRVTVKKIDSTGNTVTIAPASGTIDGAANKTISTQWSFLSFISDGTNWFLV